MPQVSLINTRASWERAAARLSQEPELALDTESNSLYTYRERICLIQIATREEVFILDPLAVQDLSALEQLLADPSIVKVLHGSDYDLRSFDRDYGCNITALFDTETASRLLGETSPNLASMLETFLGVEIPKSRKLQRSNWGLRPLSALALDYASNDVRYLISLADQLRQRLDQLGRLEWLQEECQRLEQARYKPPRPPDVALFRVKGSEQLRPRALAVFKELFLWREREAKSLDWPPFQVVGNEALVSLAQASTSSAGAQSARVQGLYARMSRRIVEGVQAAIGRGLTGAELHRPEAPGKASPWTPASQERLRRLKRWRTARGDALGLDPALLWPAASLERLALDPQAGRAEILEHGTTEVRSWQRREFGQELVEALGG